MKQIQKTRDENRIKFQKDLTSLPVELLIKLAGIYGE